MINEGYQPRASKSAPKPPGPEVDCERPPPPPEPPPRSYNGAGVRVDRSPATEYHADAQAISSRDVFTFCISIALCFCFGFVLGVCAVG